MTQINLLPWREQMRQIKKTQFITLLIICAFISVMIIAILHIHYSSIANEKFELNNALTAAINDQQNALNDMSSKEEVGKNLDVQLNFIIGLYNESYNAVRFLNEIITLVPDSILVTQIKRNGNQITLTGIANSENDITQLLNDITKSPYFNQPTLSSINVGKNTPENARMFKMLFEQKG